MRDETLETTFLGALLTEIEMAAIELTVVATTSTRTFGHPHVVKNLSVVKSRATITTGTLQQGVNEHFLL